jgi:hypothetical protein
MPLGLALLPQNDNRDRSVAFAEAATFLAHQQTCPMAFLTLGDNVNFPQRAVWKFGWIFKQFGTMVLAQPDDQSAFDVFAIFDANLRGASGPPLGNATVTNRFTSIEERAGIGAAKILLTPRARTDTQKVERVLETSKFKLVAG